MSRIFSPNYVYAPYVPLIMTFGPKAGQVIKYSRDVSLRRHLDEIIRFRGKGDYHINWDFPPIGELVQARLDLAENSHSVGTVIEFDENNVSILWTHVSCHVVFPPRIIKISSAEMTERLRADTHNASKQISASEDKSIIKYLKKKISGK